MTLGATLAASQVVAQPTCSIAPDKKVLINAVLCGQYAQEKEYQRSGRGCVEASIEMRLRDTAAQVRVLQVCGYDQFAEDLLRATMKAMRMMAVLATCTPETLDVQAVMVRATKFVDAKAQGLSCTNDLKARIENRMSQLNVQIEQLSSDQSGEHFYGQIGVKVDRRGNVSDK